MQMLDENFPGTLPNGWTTSDNPLAFVQKTHLSKGRNTRLQITVWFYKPKFGLGKQKKSDDDVTTIKSKLFRPNGHDLIKKNDYITRSQNFISHQKEAFH